MAGRGRVAFVTGATGFVALNLVDELLRRGWQVYALHREGSARASMLKALPNACSRLNLISGDLLMAPLAFVDLVPHDCDCIFHICHLEESEVHPARKLSAPGFQPEGAEEHKRVNHQAMSNVIYAAKTHKTRRIVYCSSWSSYGRQPDNTELTEATKSVAHDRVEASCCCGFVGVNASPVPYFESKLELEERLREATAARGADRPPNLPPERSAMVRGVADDAGVLEAVVIQPASIFGRYGDAGWCLMFEKLQKSKGSMPGLPGASSFVDVQDLAAAFVAAADVRPGTAYQRYIVGGENHTNLEMQHLMAEILGTPAPRTATPPALLSLLSIWNESLLPIPILRWLRVKPDTIGSPWLVAKITQNQSTRSLAAQSALGIKPRPLASILRRNYDWLASTGAFQPSASKKAS